MQYILDVRSYSLLASEHKWGHFFAVYLSQISSVLDQSYQVCSILVNAGIMDRLFLLIVLNANDISENREQLFEKFRVGIDSCTMNRRTEIVAVIVFDNVVFFQLIKHAEIPCQKAVMFL